jgi:hypothetical protein
MDILIDLIIYLIKQASKPRAPSIVPASPQEKQRRTTAVAKQVQTMQKTVAVQQSRTRPAVRPPGAGPASWAQPGVRAVVQPVIRSVVSPIADAPLSRPKQPATRIPGLKLPFLLGEILGPPVAFRDTEF